MQFILSACDGPRRGSQSSDIPHTIPPSHGLPDLVAIDRVCFNRGSLDSLLVLIVWQFSFVAVYNFAYHSPTQCVESRDMRFFSDSFPLQTFSPLLESLTRTLWIQFKYKGPSCACPF